MKKIKIVYGKTGRNTNEDIITIEKMIEEKVNNGYKIISSNMAVIPATRNIYRQLMDIRNNGKRVLNITLFKY